MNRTDAETLRRLAHLVRLRSLDSREFLAATERTSDVFDRDVPDCVRRLAALIRFRHADLDELALADVIDGEAARLEREASAAGDC